MQKLNTKYMYYGSHLHCVEACFNAGRSKEAASWIERELGEENENLSYGKIDPSTLSPKWNGFEFQLYADTLQGMSGDGI